LPLLDGTRHAHRIAVQFKSASNFVYSRVQQRRVPQPPAIASRTKSFSLPKQAQVFSRESSSAISGFRSLCGREQRSSLSHRAQSGPGFWNLSLGAGSLISRELWHPPVASTGPATLDRRCATNVVVPGGYSKRFFCVPMGLYRGKNRPVTARRMPARSDFGGPAGVTPAAASNPWTSPLWPCPTSMTRAPPGASSREACGAIRR
jgi:hypothetical protein